MHAKLSLMSYRKTLGDVAQMGPKEAGCQDVNWIHLAQDMMP
jgi:hypothetical protein